MDVAEPAVRGGVLWDGECGDDGGADVVGEGGVYAEGGSSWDGGGKGEFVGRLMGWGILGLGL